MTDLKMMKLCAEAIGIKIIALNERGERTQSKTPWEYVLDSDPFQVWSPLTNDAQMVLLVKKLKLGIMFFKGDEVRVDDFEGQGKFCSTGYNLNRAVVECASKMVV